MKEVLIVSSLLFGILFNSCKVRTVENLNDKNINEGFACGDIDSVYGNIVIVAPLDSINYLRLNIQNVHTTMHSGSFTIEKDITKENDNDSETVELLSFLGTQKENTLGYIWDCSDVGTNMAHPDTLNCLSCHVVVFVSPSYDKNGTWIRIYRLEVTDAVFIEGNKQKVIRKYKSRSIYFHNEFPG